MNKCVIALQEKDVDGLDRTAGAIRGRAARVVHVVTSEMDNYEPGIYTEKVLEATKLLTNTGTTEFLNEPKTGYLGQKTTSCILTYVFLYDGIFR